jgi:hypothetical protein
MDFGSCVKSQAVGPRENRVTFVGQLRLIGKNDSRRFSEFERVPFAVAISQTTVD